MIPLGRPFLDDAEIANVQAVFDSGYLVQGPQVLAFETELKSRCQRDHAVALSNGTSALVLALQAIGIKAGDRVICPAMTWPSPANAIKLLGAEVVLVDVRADDWNIDPAEVAKLDLSSIRAAICIDQFGNPLRKKALQDVLGDIPIVEDAACALGSFFADKTPCGSLGEISTFSFHPRKVITTGEGGAALSDNEEYSTRLRVLRNHGQLTSGHFVDYANNFRLSDIAASIGNAQLKKLDEMIIVRRKQYARYHAELECSGVHFQQEVEGACSNYQTIGVTLPKDMDRDSFIARGKEEGVQFGILSFALSSLNTLAVDVKAPVAESIVANSVALPAFHHMREEEQSRVIEVVKKLCRR